MAQANKKEETTQPNWAELFDTGFAGWAKSPTMRHIWRQVYGEDYPEEVDPFSFVTVTDLRRMVQELQVGTGQTFADLACGRGGPGLWVARESGAALVGIDFSRVAVAHATRRTGAFGLSGRAQFKVGDFTATGLPAGAFDGAMSVDALWIVPDKAAAVREVARILHSGARFCQERFSFGQKQRYKNGHFRRFASRYGTDLLFKSEHEGFRRRFGDVIRPDAGI